MAEGTRTAASLNTARCARCASSTTLVLAATLRGDSRAHLARTEPDCTTGLARPGPGLCAGAEDETPLRPASRGWRVPGLRRGGRGLREAARRARDGASGKRRGGHRAGLWGKACRAGPPGSGATGTGRGSGAGRGLRGGACIKRRGPQASALRRPRAWCWGLWPRVRSSCSRRSCRCRRWRWASRTAAATPRTCARPRPAGAACGTWGLSYLLSSCCCCAGSQPAVSGSAASGNGHTPSHTCHQHLSLAT